MGFQCPVHAFRSSTCKLPHVSISRADQLGISRWGFPWSGSALKPEILEAFTCEAPVFAGQDLEKNALKCT